MTPEIRRIVQDGRTVAIIARWFGLSGDDTGDWAELVGSPRSVQVARSEPSEDGECVIEGSCDNADDGYILHSAFGSELRFKGNNNSEVISEVTQFLRPRAIGAKDKPFNVTIMVLL